MIFFLIMQGAFTTPPAPSCPCCIYNRPSRNTSDRFYILNFFMLISWLCDSSNFVAHTICLCPIWTRPEEEPGLKMSLVIQIQAKPKTWPGSENLLSQRVQWKQCLTLERWKRWDRWVCFFLYYYCLIGQFPWLWVSLSVNLLSSCELGPEEASRHKQLYGSGPRTRDHRRSNVPLSTEPSDPEPHRARSSATAAELEAALRMGRVSWMERWSLIRLMSCDFKYTASASSVFDWVERRWAEVSTAHLNKSVA